MPQGPYSGLGYQLSAIGAQVPAGYMRGVEMRNQQDASEQNQQYRQEDLGIRKANQEITLQEIRERQAKQQREQRIVAYGQQAEGDPKRASEIAKSAGDYEAETFWFDKHQANETKKINLATQYSSMDKSKRDAHEKEAKFFYGAGTELLKLPDDQIPGATQDFIARNKEFYPSLAQFDGKPVSRAQLQAVVSEAKLHVGAMDEAKTPLTAEGKIKRAVATGELTESEGRRSLEKLYRTTDSGEDKTPIDKRIFNAFLKLTGGDEIEAYALLKEAKSKEKVPPTKQEFVAKVISQQVGSGIPASADRIKAAEDAYTLIYPKEAPPLGTEIKINGQNKKWNGTSWKLID